MASKICFFDIFVNESCRWRHQSRAKKRDSETAGDNYLNTRWKFRNFQLWKLFISEFHMPTFAPFWQNTIRKSGNRPYDHLSRGQFSGNSIAKMFCFLALNITCWIIHAVISSFFRIWVTWPQDQEVKKSSYRFWRTFC